MSSSPVPPGDPDPSFTFDYTPLDLPDDRPHALPDDLGEVPARRRTTYWDVERGSRGPQPLPGWVVTDAGAVDTELGVLKSGKEADVFLLERAATDGSGQVCLLAAKRYRDDRHRAFHRASTYTEGRRTRRSRDARAMERRSGYGRAVAAGQWARSEWQALVQAWSSGLPVPYPVQVDGTEILMEFIGDDDGAAAPRLVQLRPEPEALRGYYEQLRGVVLSWAGAGVAHGDLSPYNVLVEGHDVVVIDLPQLVDLAVNPQGPAFLHRDCLTLCAWFVRRGLDVDAEELFAEAMAVAR